ncbi:serine protease [Streptomyces sp. NPDC059740]|uniref:VMAP-C domain-containing protein n=1 Tax=Streptomyces sp. NPDC059740 TaxID=3346926 RepID=UPI00364FF14E
MSPAEGRSHDAAVHGPLLDLAGRATVAVRAAPGSPENQAWGSGVLVAPGWVLTCAHVLSRHGVRRPTGPRGEVGCVLNLPAGRRLVAARQEYDLTRRVPGGPVEPADRPDLALLRLLDEVPDHPCAWLADRSAVLLSHGAAFRGHTGTTGAPVPGAEPAAADEEHHHPRAATGDIGSPRPPAGDPERYSAGLPRARSSREAAPPPPDTLPTGGPPAVLGGVRGADAPTRSGPGPTATDVPAAGPLPAPALPYEAPPAPPGAAPAPPGGAPPPGRVGRVPAPQNGSAVDALTPPGDGPRARKAQGEAGEILALGGDGTFAVGDPGRLPKSAEDAFSAGPARGRSEGRRAGTGPTPPTEAAAPDDPPGPDSFVLVRFGGQHGHALMLGSDVRITPGASGGPLLDCDRGEVIGVIRRSHRQDVVAVAEPVSLLRGLHPDHQVPGTPGLGPDPYHALMSLHDRWHWQRSRLGGDGEETWLDAQRTVTAEAGRPWGVEERLLAFEILSRLPAPRDPAAVREAVARALPGRQIPPAVPLPTWRDGHGALYVTNDAYGELRNVVHYLRIVAEETAADAREAAREAGPGETATAAQAVRAAADLERLVELRARSLSAQDRAAIGPVRARVTSVLVDFDPLFYGEGDTAHVNWSVSEGYGDGRWDVTDLHQSPAGVPFEEAQALLLRRLGPRLLAADHAGATAAAGGGAGPVRLEVVVPEGYWHLAADRWSLPASTRRTRRTHPVGEFRAVVLRDSERRGGEHPAWDAHFDRLRNAARLVALRVGPREAGRAVGPSLRRLLRDAGPGAVPTLCRSVAWGPGQDVVYESLQGGHAVALWFAQGHEDRGCDEECDRRHQLLDAFLADCGAVADLPERVRELREQVAEGEAPWAQGLLLLYDDPRDPLPPVFGRSTHLTAAP